MQNPASQPGREWPWAGRHREDIQMKAWASPPPLYNVLAQRSQSIIQPTSLEPPHGNGGEPTPRPGLDATETWRHQCPRSCHRLAQGRGSSLRTPGTSSRRCASGHMRRCALLTHRHCRVSVARSCQCCEGPVHAIPGAFLSEEQPGPECLFTPEAV